MGTEVERKFLVDKARWAAANAPAGKLYKQGYISTASACTVRVRITGDAAYITLKGPTQGISRSEYEYEIPINDGIEMLDSFAASIVQKTRHFVDYAGKIWEVDVFEGDNAGLIIAEIELRHADEAFEKPAWITEEVSHDPRYYNSALSVNPYKNW